VAAAAVVCQPPCKWLRIDRSRTHSAANRQTTDETGPHHRQSAHRTSHVATTLDRRAVNTRQSTAHLFYAFLTLAAALTCHRKLAVITY
jgi:hypothetical protein